MSDRYATGPIQLLRLAGRRTSARIILRLLETVRARSRRHSSDAEVEGVQTWPRESSHGVASKPDLRSEGPGVPRPAQSAEALMLELRKRLCVLTSELVQSEEGERRSSAIFLHEHLSQTLTRLQDRLGLLQRGDDCARKADELEHVTDLLKDATVLARRLTVGVSPRVRCERELASAFRWLGEELSGGRELDFDLELDGEPTPLSQVDAALLYGASRELLRSIAMHSGASAIRAAVRWRPAAVEIEVRNDCVEPPLGAAHGDDEHCRLFGVRERIEAMGGSIEIGTGTDKGTRVSLIVPLQSLDEREEV